jgi:hypothetical protein
MMIFPSAGVFRVVGGVHDELYWFSRMAISAAARH